MKILQINKFFYLRGGAERYLFALSELLKSAGHEVIYFSQKNPRNFPCPQEPYFISDLELGHFSFKTLFKLPRIFHSREAKRQLKKLLAAEKPDLVHLHNIYHQISPSILPVIKRAGLPLVMTVHDFKLIKADYALRADGRKIRPKNSWLAQAILVAEFYWQNCRRIYQKNIDLLIAPSQFVKNQLVQHGFDEQKIVVLAHFIKPNKLFVQPAADKNYLLYFGRLEESKGVAILLRALKLTADQKLKLKIAGQGPQLAALKQLAEKLDLGERVEFLDQKNETELAELISQSKGVVIPSLVHETFGLAVLESFNQGKAVIASRVGALPEIVSEEKNGLLFAAGDADDLKNKINWLNGHPPEWEIMNRQAKKTAENYSPQKHLEQIIKIYQDLKNKSATTDKLAKLPPNQQENKQQKHLPLLIKTLIIILALGLVAAPFYINGPDKSLAYPTLQNSFPRLVNLYWKTAITKEEARELSRWDLVVLDMQAQNLSADNIRYLRELNPQIIILAYTSANEAPLNRLNEVEPAGTGLWHDLTANLQPEWQLKTASGKNISWWPGNISLNLYPKDKNGRSYGDYLIGFYQNKILATGLWDGLLFDNVWQTVAWVDANIDIDADGQFDSVEKINRLWSESNANFFKKLRQAVGSKYLILGNGDGEYHDYLNGRMFEAWPEIWEGGWTGQTKKYLALGQNGYAPRLSIINADTNNTGNYRDWQKLRFSLASALLGDGYFSFDYGTKLREQLWWYDEYDATLGKAAGEPFNLLDRNNREIKPGVWQRDFSGGVALVNSTNEKQIINFDGEYEKIRGTQDKAVNNGAIVNRLELSAQDGIILLRPINKITDAVFVNGSFARIFNADGQNVRAGFFAYDANFPGGAKIIYTDINSDGELETVVAGENSVSIYNKDQIKLALFYPYGEKFRGGLSLALVDFDHDGNREIILAPERGAANLIKVYNWRGEEILSFNAYKAEWKNLGAAVAAGDVNGDGEPEIITGAGWGGGPHVRIFNYNGKILLGEFFAYDPDFRGGAYVAAGDLNGDGQPEIITGAGWGGGPHLAIFNGRGEKLNQWMAYDASKREGVKVASNDIDNDGKMEIIALTTNVFTK